MKPKVFTAILLFISAYSPLFFILGVKDFDFDDTWKFSHPWVAGVLFLLSIGSNILVLGTFKSVDRGNTVAAIKSVRSRSQDIINYTIPYIFCAFDVDFSKMDHVISIVLFLLILMILTIASQSVFLNPMLALMGYNFYDVDYERDGGAYSTIGISKLDLRVGNRYYIKSLTRFIYLFTEEKQQSNASASQTSSS